MLRPGTSKALPLAALLLTASLLLFFIYSELLSNSWNFDPSCRYFQPCLSKSPIETESSPQTSLATPTSIPQKLWYKTGPKGISDESQVWIQGCLDQNPTYRYEFLSDNSAEQYIREFYAHRPDILATYLSLNVPILKADLLRYLILYAEGGIWSDLDVSCDNVPIENWIPDEFRESANLVVGLEFDMEWENDGFLHSQFASWMIMAKHGSRHLGLVIDDILADIHTTALENDVDVSGLTFAMIPEVVDMSGPKRMTRGIVKSLGYLLGQAIDDRHIAGLGSPKLIGDVLILPANSFAASQAGYPKNQGPPLVTHHYAGTWKNSYGGEMSEIKV